VPVTIEEPALVPMAEAEPAAAVSVLVDIFTVWWTKQGSGVEPTGRVSRSARP
jgi:hypothetical protein